MTANSELEAAIAAANKLHEAHAASTQGEWVWGRTSTLRRIVIFEEDNELTLKAIIGDISSVDSDAAFIVLAHNELPCVLAVFAAFQEENARLRAFVQSLADREPVLSQGNYYHGKEAAYQDVANQAEIVLLDIKDGVKADD